MAVILGARMQPAVSGSVSTGTKAFLESGRWRYAQHMKCMPEGFLRSASLIVVVSVVSGMMPIVRA